VHETPLACLSLSNLTESGAVYTAGEIAALASLAHAHGLRVHLDGARFANAVVAAGARPADLSWKAGVDVMSFGATKNGALGCEAVLLFGDSRAMGRELRIRAKRAGHMPPKMRFLAAQMTAYLDGGRWLELARRANESAQALADVFSRAGHPLRRPADGNEVFVDLTPAASEALSRAGARFYPWIDGSFRFVCSWATPPEEIAALAEALPPA
jgi:threonine aldolase